MRFTNIHLENFLSFENIDLNFNYGHGIHVFQGPSGIGKTSLLKLLYTSYIAGWDGLGLNKVFEVLGIQDGCSSVRVNHNIDTRIVLSGISSTWANCTMSFQFSDELRSFEMSYDHERDGDMWTKSRCVYIPSAEIPLYSYYSSVLRDNDNLFDPCIADLYNLTGHPFPLRKFSNREAVKTSLEEMIGGVPSFHNGLEIKFGPRSPVALSRCHANARRLSVLWALVNNGAIFENSVLLWDSPEADLSATNIYKLAKVLMAIQAAGVQVIISTNNDMMIKALFDASRGDMRHDICFYSLYRDENGYVKCDIGQEYALLNHNEILDMVIKLYEEEIYSYL